MGGGAMGGAGGGFAGAGQGAGVAVCGGACGGYDEATILTYVGPGGNYVAETNYKYVGKGAGEFEAVLVPTNYKQGYFYCVVAFALVAVVIYLLNPMAPTTTTT